MQNCIVAKCTNVHNSGLRVKGSDVPDLRIAPKTVVTVVILKCYNKTVVTVAKLKCYNKSVVTLAKLRCYNVVTPG